MEQVFQEKFHFQTEQYDIPPTESKESLFNRLQVFSRHYDSPSKLGIIYYGGHAERVESKDGVDLELFARRSLHGISNGSLTRTNTSLSNISIPESPTDTKGEFDVPLLKARPEQPHISFKAICEEIRTSETDILLIVDSCFAAGAFTDQPFSGRKCELFCSIAEKDWARAPGQQGSFTKILTNTLEKMIGETPEGFSTSDLYRRVYQQQHQAHKPFHFTQSRFDFGRIWLRPCRQKDKATEVLNDSMYTIDVRFQFTKSLDMPELNKVVKALQYIPYVQMVTMQSMHSPNDDLRKFIRTVYLANRLRPVLARVRRSLELKRARQLCRTSSTPPSPAATTSEQFHFGAPRDVGLFDWSKAQAVTKDEERLTSDQYLKLHLKLHDLGVPTEALEHPTSGVAALQLGRRQAPADAPAQTTSTFLQRATNICLSQRALDGLLFFGMGVLAPTVLSWAVHGSA